MGRRSEIDGTPGHLLGARLRTQPQHLLLTLLGDYWYGREEPLPLRALIALLGEFGISESGARAAVNRLAKRDLVHASRRGRTSWYRLTKRADDVLTDGQRRIFAFGQEEAPWDGEWVVVAFSVGEDRRELRHLLRTRLRWLGFGPLYDGVWVSPKPVAHETITVLRDLGVDNATVFEAVAPPEGPGQPWQAWDLEEVRAAYGEFLDAFSPLLERVRRGGVGSAEALVERTAVMDAWRRFPSIDPDLPLKVLPDDWPRRRAQETFKELYSGLGQLAEARFQQVLAYSVNGHPRL